VSSLGPDNFLWF